MRAWRVAKRSRARDLSGAGAAITGGRWNDRDVPALYLGMTPAICCLESFVHAAGRPSLPMAITSFDLPVDPGLYFEPEAEDLPQGWQSMPMDRPSMAFGTAVLQAGQYLGLIVPSAVLPLERNIILNPSHPAMRDVLIVEVFDFTYDERMFTHR